MSKAAAWGAPSLFWTQQAVAGVGMSGVMVAMMINSRSVGFRPASARALLAASVAISEVVCPGAATWRSLIPVRVTIHSSEVSTIFSISWLVRILSGR